LVRGNQANRGGKGLTKREDPKVKKKYGLGK